MRSINNRTHLEKLFLYLEANHLLYFVRGKYIEVMFDNDILTIQVGDEA